MSLFDPICSSLIQFIPFWSNLIKFEHVWASLNQFSPFGSNLIKFEWIRTNLSRLNPFGSNLIQLDQVWSNLIMFDQFWSCLIKFDQVWTICFKIAQKCSKFSKMVDDDKKLFLRPRAKPCLRSKSNLISIIWGKFGIITFEFKTILVS